LLPLLQHLAHCWLSKITEVKKKMPTEQMVVELAMLMLGEELGDEVAVDAFAVHYNLQDLPRTASNVDGTWTCVLAKMK